MKDYQAQFEKETGKSLILDTDYITLVHNQELYRKWLEKYADDKDQAIIGQEMIIHARDMEIEKLKGE